MFDEPAPSTYQALGGLPGRQFSASIAFLGAVHVANAESARHACASVRSRTLLKARLIQTSNCGWRHSASCRRESHSRGEPARRKAKVGTCDSALRLLTR